MWLGVDLRSSTKKTCMIKKKMALSAQYYRLIASWAEYNSKQLSLILFETT